MFQVEQDVQGDGIIENEEFIPMARQITQRMYAKKRLEQQSVLRAPKRTGRGATALCRESWCHRIAKRAGRSTSPMNGVALTDDLGQLATRSQSLVRVQGPDRPKIPEQSASLYRSVPGIIVASRLSVPTAGHAERCRLPLRTGSRTFSM
ncbi:unnamed protein product [Symbiodinium sp. CCMP2592]|nr:unnamed protein product [Symbiodinium sp. CCMP2592]